jgi:hypothetical protein
VTDTQVPARTGAAAVQLRVSGASYSDIALTLGLRNARTALTMVTKELALQGEGEDDARDRLRNEESARLMHLLGPVMTRASDVMDPEHLAAVRTAVTIIDRRIKLLGLDAPTEITIHTPTQTELDNWVTAMVVEAMPNAALEEPDIIEGEVIE